MNGILNLNKPSGITSRKALDRVRRTWKIKKAGHGGTLDPDAKGVLLICIGKATKLFDRLQIGTKSYAGTITLGITTDTFDSSGKILTTNVIPDLTDQQIVEVAEKFVGEIDQTVPPFSAVKRKGQPLYKMARRGIEVTDLPIKRVRIKSLKIEAIRLPEIDFRLDCSKGTYIRSLASDIGKELGCGAILSDLTRTRSGIFRIEEAFSLEQIESGNVQSETAVIPIDAVVEALDRAERKN